MIQPKIWPYFFNDKYAESEKILEPLLKRFPYNPFINTLSAISFYTQKKIVQARERLDQVINEGSGNPIMIYLVFVITDQFHDFNYQCALAEVLTKKFPYSYPTMVASAIWNCRMGNFEQGISQLFGCIDKIPQDLVAAGMLMRMLKSKGYDSLSGAVREYMSSAMLKSTIYHHMFSNLFGIKEK